MVPEDVAKLDDASAVLKKNPDATVLVEGHADQRGDYNYNLMLSKSRAQVVDYFLRNRGIGMNRITSLWYGNSRLADIDNSPKAWARNRRVNLLIWKDEP
jgi:peptidoglycan-associated lipoprotein